MGQSKRDRMDDDGWTPWVIVRKLRARIAELEMEIKRLRDGK